MARIKIMVRDNSYSPVTTAYVLPELSDEQANALVPILARAQLVSLKHIGSDYSQPQAWVTDPSRGLAVEVIHEADSVISPRVHAELSAEAEEQKAIKQQEAARLSREAALAVPA